MKRYPLNSMAKFMKNCQVPIGKLIPEDCFPSLYEWDFHDLAEINCLVVEIKIDGITVKYNKPLKQVFVDDLRARTQETICSIYNTLEYGNP